MSEQNQLLHNPHPGEILEEEFLIPMNISRNELARRIRVPSNRISQITSKKRSISADTDIRLCKFFELEEGFFLRLQDRYQIMEAKRNMGDQINFITSYQKISNNTK